MMASCSVVTVTLMILSLSAKPTFAISIPSPDRNFPPEGDDHLIGDGDGDSVQLNRPTSSSLGIIRRSTPFNSSSSTSVSSHFTFEIGNGVALVIIPADFNSMLARNKMFGLLDANRFLVIEFYINFCQISSSGVINISKFDNLLKDGVNLSSWVDYCAISKRLDVWLSKLGDPKPVETLISYRIDLGEMFEGDDIILGLASSSENQEHFDITSVDVWSSYREEGELTLAGEKVLFGDLGLTSSNEKHEQITVFSWSYEIKVAPTWLHSVPVNPIAHSAVQTSVISRFIFATCYGAMAASIMFFVWLYVVDQLKVQVEASARPVDLKYEKIDVLEVKNSKETAMK